MRRKPTIADWIMANMHLFQDRLDMVTACELATGASRKTINKAMFRMKGTQHDPIKDLPLCVDGELTLTQASRYMSQRHRERGTHPPRRTEVRQPKEPAPPKAPTLPPDTGDRTVEAALASIPEGHVISDADMRLYLRVYTAAEWELVVAAHPMCWIEVVRKGKKKRVWGRSPALEFIQERLFLQ